MIVQMQEINKLLKEGKSVKIKTRTGGYSPVTKYIEKGVLDTFCVLLENAKSIKVSREHKFFTNSGWVETQYLRPELHSILCDTGEYSLIKSIVPIGKHLIVDITVDDDEHAYFGNGMLNHNSGKSLVAASILRSTQQQGGIGVLIDTEIATNREFLVAQGIDLAKLVIVNKETIEDIFEAITDIITRVRESEQSSKKLVTIVVDSVAGATTKRELESDFQLTGYATDKAILIGSAMRKLTMMLGRERVAVVLTNQLRHKMNAPSFSDPWTTSGGKAIAFHSSTRIRLTQIGKIKNATGTVIGVNIKAKVDKNRLGPPHRESEFDVYFSRGLDDHRSWLDAMVDAKIIKKAGAWYSYTDDDTGEETKLQSKDFKQFINSDLVRKEKIYDKICEASIIRYETELDQDQIVREKVAEEE